MKKILEFFAGMALAAPVLFLFVLLMLVTAQAQQTDGYTSVQDVTTTTNFNQVVLPGAVTKQILVRSWEINSDTNVATLEMFAGTTPFTVTGIINSTNLVVASTAGIVTNQLAILQYGNTNWVVNVGVTNQGTNVILLGGSTLGITVPTNTTFWNCTNRLKINVPIGVTRSVGGEVFAAVVRAPFCARLSPSLFASGASSGSNRVHVAAQYVASP